MKLSVALAVLAADLALAKPGASPRCHCCTALAKTPGLEGKVWTADQQRYDDRLGEYYSANAALAPWCMVFPEGAEDVSSIVQTLVEKDCPFGMRSGAHSAFAGSNGIEDGVTVDFGYMNATTYDEENMVASIQPGSSWGPVYEALAPHEVVAVGGRADVVGVGGFTTGGGYSFHTGMRGFACDNVVNFEVVLGDGSIVNANSNENADLWKALKGGSGNFGFVTRIDQEVFPSNQVYANLNSYTLDKKPAVRQAFFDFVNNQDKEPESQMIISTSWRQNRWGASAIMSNINAEITESFDPFFEIEARSRMPATGPAHEVVKMFTGPTPLGLFANWQTGMVSLDLEMMAAMDEIVIEYMEAMLASVSEDSTLELIFQWQPVTQGIVDKMNERGGNVLGLDAVVADGPTVMYNLVFTVDTAENQDIVLQTAFEMNDAVLAKADELGHSRHWEFLNYAHGRQDPLSHYGAENIAFMNEVSKKYDQQQVFQKLRQTGFHLPDGPAPPVGPKPPKGPNPPKGPKDPKGPK